MWQIAGGILLAILVLVLIRFAWGLLQAAKIIIGGTLDPLWPKLRRFWLSGISPDRK